MRILHTVLVSLTITRRNGDTTNDIDVPAWFVEDEQGHAYWTVPYTPLVEFRLAIHEEHSMEFLLEHIAWTLAEGDDNGAGVIEADYYESHDDLEYFDPMTRDVTVYTLAIETAARDAAYEIA